ncbi:gliding motility-associated C-terminal domain-containing protein, partial [Marivirga sericea]
ATAVSFGGTPASSFIVDSPTQITAILAVGSSGSVQVITPGGTATRAGFTLITSPEVNITSFTPISGALGETITITGTNFTSASFVSFGGTPATTFTVDSPTQITATLANGSSGTVEVGTPSGSASLIGFIFIPAPTITGFSPIIAASEATVTITGTNFTGTTAVSFGGTNALSFIVTSPTEINAEVANGTSGSIEVTTPGGKATLAGFEFIEGPTILSVSPTSLGANQIATIIGTGFTSTFSVSFGGTEALSFAVVSDSEITAVVGPGASGDVIVTSLGGTASFSGFKFIPAPTISSFNPTSAFEGQIVTIVGTDFLNTSSVHFGDSKAISFDVISNNEIKAVVGSESSGSVMITTLGGAASREGFTFLFSQIALSRSENNPIASEQSEPIFLGTVLTEESLQSDFIISNTGNANLLISNITSSDDAFEIVNFPSSIDPGSSGEFTVQFNDSDVGNFESEIRIENNSSNSPAFVFTVSAERSGVNVIDNETDSVIISNQNVDVGSTILNVDVNKTFNIENLSSNSVIEITSILIDNPVFQITSAPLSIAPLSTEEFTIRLNANTVGRYLAIVLVTTNLNEFSFQVVGEVLPEASTEINVYNVVTPNGDGRHDYLQIENITEYTNNSVSIYNRLGNKVFDINNYNNSSKVFEGLSNNGEELLTGNYYYVIDKGNGDKRITGFLLIKR